MYLYSEPAWSNSKSIWKKKLNYFFRKKKTNDESHRELDKWIRHNKQISRIFKCGKSIANENFVQCGKYIRFRYRMPYNCWFISRVRDCVQIQEDPRHCFVSCSIFSVHSVCSFRPSRTWRNGIYLNSIKKIFGSLFFFFRHSVGSSIFIVFCFHSAQFFYRF